MPRGGYQKPSNPASTSGPGKFSERTDGGPSDVQPSLDDEGVQYGDVGMLERAAQDNPIKGAQGASSAPSSGSSRRLSGAAPSGGSLPPWFTTSADTAPSDPTTTGLASGPGAGPEVLDASTPSPDIRETVLEWMVQTYGNEDVRDMLNSMRNEREGRVAQAMPTPSAPMGPGLPTEPEESSLAPALGSE